MNNHPHAVGVRHPMAMNYQKNQNPQGSMLPAANNGAVTNNFINRKKINTQ